MTMSEHQCDKGPAIARVEESCHTLGRDVGEIKSDIKDIFNLIQPIAVSLATMSESQKNQTESHKTLISRLWGIGLMAFGGLAGSLWSIFTGGGKP